MELQPAVRLTLILFFLAAVAIPIHGAIGEIKKCQTIDVPGPYVLTQNIESNPNLRVSGDCLVVAADFVTIDLAGYSIIGHGSGSGITTVDPFKRGLTIRGGTIRNFSTGIRVDDALQAVVTIENMFLIGNIQYGILTLAGVIRNNVCTGNFDGIVTFFSSIITGNHSSNNMGDGISAGNGSTVIGNVTSSNGGSGLTVSNGCTVQNNTAFLNKGTGIHSFGNSAVIGNTAYGNSVDLVTLPSDTRAHNNPAP